MIEKIEKTEKTEKTETENEIIKKAKIIRMVINILVVLVMIMLISTASAEVIPPDVTPPLSITSIKNITYNTDNINWTWNDPRTADFAKVMVYINGIYKGDILKGIRYYNAIGLNPDTSYRISTHTVDTSGNINQTWRNNTAKTAKDKIPPLSITNLKNITYKPTYINWSWNDPGDTDFAYVKVYLDGVYKGNVIKGVRYYNATGLIPNSWYKIMTNTVDTSGNINLTWVNKSTMTAKDNIKPANVSKLHDISYAPNYINWTWKDPSDIDLSGVLVYIDGIYKGKIIKGKQYYNLTGLLSNKTYKISTRTIDTSGNINLTWVNHTAKTTPISYKIKFITIGDPQVDDDPVQGSDRLREAVKYINNLSGINFVVVVGDITQDKTYLQFDLSKSILDKLNKPYYVIPGNHDVSDYNATNSQFTSRFGSMEKFRTINGYQLLLVGIWKEKVGGNSVIHWSYNYSSKSIDRNKPTLVFIHGAVKNPPPSYPCSWSEAYFKYGASMQPELDKFTKLMGVYSGHVHTDTDQIFATPWIENVRYTTINGLVDLDNGCRLVDASDYIGLSQIVDGKLTSYQLIPYVGAGNGSNITSMLVTQKKVYRTDIDNPMLEN